MEDGLAHAVCRVYSPSVGVYMQDYVVRSLVLSVLKPEAELAHGGVVDILLNLDDVDRVLCRRLLRICRNG